VSERGESHTHDEIHEHHIVPPRTYVIIILSLLTLTGLTVAAAYVPLGPFNIVVALGIATLKATLVVLFFMHAKYSGRRTQLVIVAGIFWLALLLFMTMSDYESRIDYRGKRFPIMQNITRTIHQRG
jgi:cytochrome c oxidase subunit IV